MAIVNPEPLPIFILLEIVDDRVQAIEQIPTLTQAIRAKEYNQDLKAPESTFSILVVNKPTLRSYVY